MGGMGSSASVLASPAAGKAVAVESEGNFIDLDAVPSSATTGEGKRGGSIEAGERGRVAEVRKIDFEDGEDVPMTQEEEEVNYQLKSLSCSQEAGGVDDANDGGKEDVFWTPVGPKGLKENEFEGDAMEDADKVVCRDRSVVGAAKDLGEGEGKGVLKESDGMSDRQDLSLPDTEVDGEHGLFQERVASTPSSKDSVSSASDGVETYGNNVSVSDSESDEDDDALLQPLATRRSSRAAVPPPRYDPSRLVAMSSVFEPRSTRCPRGGRVKNSASALMADVERERAREAELEKLRSEVDGDLDSQDGSDEDVEAYKRMAAAHERERLELLRVFNSYERPSPLFTTPVRMLSMDEELLKLTGRGGRNVLEHPLLSLLVRVLRDCPHGVDIGETVSLHEMKWTVDGKSRPSISPEKCDKLLALLWQLSVHDDTPARTASLSITSHSGDRSKFQEVLVSLLSSEAGGTCRALPPVLCLLACFGADFDDAMTSSQAGVSAMDVDGSSDIPCASPDGEAEVINDLIRVKTVGMESGSLDYETVANAEEGVGDTMFSRCVRNLQRAFAAYSAAVRGGMSLQWLGKSEREEGAGLLKGRLSSGDDWFDDDTESVKILLATCGKVLSSPFGNEIAHEVGSFMEAVISRVDESSWASVRWDAAKTFVKQSSRLKLQGAIATHLLPCGTTRSRCLQLDYAFLCLKQWSSGPADNPQLSDIADVHSSKPLPHDQHPGRLSFLLSDIVVALKDVPQIDKSSDVHWLYGVAVLAKQVLTDEDVVQRRDIGDAALLKGILTRLRRESNKLMDDTVLHLVRDTFDAVENFLGIVGQNDQSLNLEFNPLEKKEKKQQTLAIMLKK